MVLKPKEIFGSLSKDNQKLLNDVLGVEKRRLHILEIKQNTKNEKEIISEILAIIDRTVTDDN